MSTIWMLLLGAAQPVPPPPIVVTETSPARVSPRPEPRVTVHAYAPPPEAVSCSEGPARVVAADAFEPTATTHHPPPPMPPGVIPPVSFGPGVAAPLPGVTFEFNVAADGRVTGVRRSEPRASYLSGHDEGKLQATLAGWRFAPQARTGCRLALEIRSTPAEETDRATLLHLMASQPRPDVRRTLYKRANAPGDCYEGREANLRVRVYPDWERVPIGAGRKAWVALDYDIGPDGAARNVRVAGSSGNATVNRAAADAVSQFRFTDGPRTGCRHYFWPVSTETLPAPPVDKTGSSRPGDDDCPSGLLTFREQDAYPGAFKQRSIEGWAWLRFSVAPWGQIGEIEVVRAEPSELFGRAATVMLQNATATATERGLRGCAVPITFKIGDEDRVVPDSEAR